jgi:hypothetical protein
MKQSSRQAELIRDTPGFSKRKEEIKSRFGFCKISTVLRKDQPPCPELASARWQGNDLEMGNGSGKPHPELCVLRSGPRIRDTC